MVLKVECPRCSHVFSIELIRIKREMELLKTRNKLLEAQIKEMKGMAALKDLFGGFK